MKHTIAILAIFCLILLFLVAFNCVSFAQDGIWIAKKDMPNPRAGACSAVVNGKIYVISGSKAGAVPMSIVEEYNPLNDTWTRKADLPSPRFLAAAAAVNGKIYVIGGGTDMVTYQSSLFEYDPVLDKWEKKANMATWRGILAAEVVNGKIYAIGGYFVGAMAGMAVVEEYDPKTDTWTKKTNMKTQRYAMGSSVVGGKIYVIGGSQGPSLSVVEVYDPVTDKWETKTPMPTPREYVSTAVVDGKIYAFGGLSSPAHGLDGIKNVEIYDPVTDSWLIKPPMPVAKVAFSCESVNQSIYIIGGESSFVFAGNLPVLASVYEYNALGLLPKTVSYHSKLAVKWGSIKNKH